MNDKISPVYDQMEYNTKCDCTYTIKLTISKTLAAFSVDIVRLVKHFVASETLAVQCRHKMQPKLC